MLVRQDDGHTDKNAKDKSHYEKETGGVAGGSIAQIEDARR